MPFVPAYDRAFWQRLTAKLKPAPLGGTLKRIVESQSQVVTLALVDSLDEQMLLEQMLESAKPPLPALATQRKLDYLLSSPWRYPPLRWGSRFGRRFEPSIFYGSLSGNALFAEAAWYRWVFLSGLDTPFEDAVVSQHTTFEAQYRAANGCDLTKAPFAKHKAVLAHRNDYAATQQLGSVLRDRGIEAFVYRSARSQQPADNVALLTPSALRSRKARNLQQWLCETLTERVSFRRNQQLISFSRGDFLAEGESPAAPLD